MWTFLYMAHTNNNKLIFFKVRGTFISDMTPFISFIFPIIGLFNPTLNCLYCNRFDWQTPGDLWYLFDRAMELFESTIYFFCISSVSLKIILPQKLQ